MTSPNPPPQEPLDVEAGEIESAGAIPPCILSFNGTDPSGAAGLAADTLAIASIGAHGLPVVTGAYIRDTAEIFDFVTFDEESVAEQARAVLEDVPVQVIKVGFAGSPEILGTIAELATDYADVPVVAYMPNLSWWDNAEIEVYQDAFRELLLPQTTVLVGNYSTLWRWLLPDWAGTRNPSARDLAQAAAQWGVPYTLVTGIPLPDQQIDNVLATPQTVLGSETFERIEATFTGAGDTLSAALAALLATGKDLAEATGEALYYLDRCLDAGYQPGMGHAVPDRLFWALPDDEDLDAPDTNESDLPSGFLDLSNNDTKH